METKNVMYELRTGKGMSQDELAEKLFVTRQAVSRCEYGETVPNTETLKLLSKLFDVSINTLLGSPRQLVCQCCGMPREEASFRARTSAAQSVKRTSLRARTASTPSATAMWVLPTPGLPTRTTFSAASRNLSVARSSTTALGMEGWKEKSKSASD